VTHWANAPREAIRDLAEVRDRLEAAGDALTGTEAALKQAEARFAAADERAAAAGNALHAACAGREAARPDRYAARQAHQRTGAMAERLQRPVSETADRLGRMALCPHMTLIRCVSVF
jgi:uncharacterized protein (DUF3084 family)